MAHPGRTVGGDGTAMLCELSPGLRLWVDSADRGIGRHIARRQYELNERDLILDVLRPGDHAVDCGAHVGYHTMHMAQAVGPAGTVTAFEPDARPAALLARSVAINGFEDRVRVVAAAVADRAGTRLLAVPRGPVSGASRLVPPGEPTPEDVEAVEVRVVALDDCPLPRPIALVKMDLEGADVLALRGADRLLREDRPVVLAEIDPHLVTVVAHTTVEALLAEMHARGYTCHLAGAGVPGPPVEEAPSHVASVVFVPV